MEGATKPGILSRRLQGRTPKEMRVIKTFSCNIDEKLYDSNLFIHNPSDHLRRYKKPLSAQRDAKARHRCLRSLLAESSVAVRIARTIMVSFGSGILSKAGVVGRL